MTIFSRIFRKPPQFAGPVRPTDDLQRFRETGETRPLPEPQPTPRARPQRARRYGGRSFSRGSGQLGSPLLSREQSMLLECFGGSYPIWGTGNNLPELNFALNSGGGLIKNGDINRRTARMFGL